MKLSKKVDISQNVKIWWALGKYIWIVLIIGYLWVFISIFSPLKINSSGAVLVGCCILSDLLFQNLSWRRMAAAVGNEFCERFEQSDGSVVFEVVRPAPYRVQTRDIASMNALQLLARSNEFDANRYWRISETSERYELRLLWVIGVSTIIGTVIWAYG